MSVAGAFIRAHNLAMHTSKPVLLRIARTSATGMLAVATLVGCGSTGPTSAPGHHESETRKHQSDEVTASDVHDRLVFEVNRWLGVDYRYGGSGRNGFDCSGFVRRVYQDALDESLPRTTREQMRVGGQVDRNRLQVGDLVFFRTPARTDHVGVYLGDGEFAHASTSSGVMVSHLGEPYWSKSYRSARRVLDLDDGLLREPVKTGATGLEVMEGDGTSSTQDGRVGW